MNGTAFLIYEYNFFFPAGAKDAKTLYVGGLPKDITQEELQGLSTDIIVANIPHKSRNATRFS